MKIVTENLSNLHHNTTRVLNKLTNGRDGVMSDWILFETEHEFIDVAIGYNSNGKIVGWAAANSNCVQWDKPLAGVYVLESERGKALRVLLYLFQRDGAIKYLRSG